MGYVACMTTTHETQRSAEPEEQIYVIRVTPGNGQIDPDLAASLERVYKVTDSDPNRWRNNPAKKKAGLEGLGRLLDEWQEENGAFTEEDLEAARISMYGE